MAVSELRPMAARVFPGRRRLGSERSGTCPMSRPHRQANRSVFRSLATVYERQDMA